MTDKEERRKKMIERCNAALARNPNCVWAKNELKYLDVAPLPQTGGICISGMAYKADSDYHGGYVE